MDNKSREGIEERRVNNSRPNVMPNSKYDRDREDDAIYVKSEDLSEAAVSTDPFLRDLFPSDGRGSTDQRPETDNADALEILEKAQVGGVSEGTLKASKTQPA